MIAADVVSDIRYNLMRCHISNTYPQEYRCMLFGCRKALMTVCRILYNINPISL